MAESKGGGATDASLEELALDADHIFSILVESNIRCTEAKLLPGKIRAMKALLSAVTNAAPQAGRDSEHPLEQSSRSAGLADAAPERLSTVATGTVNLDEAVALARKYIALDRTLISGEETLMLAKALVGLHAQAVLAVSATTAKPSGGYTTQDVHRAFREERVSQSFHDGVWTLQFTDATVRYLSGELYHPNLDGPAEPIGLSMRTDRTTKP